MLRLYMYAISNNDHCLRHEISFVIYTILLRIARKTYSRAMKLINLSVSLENSALDTFCLFFYNKKKFVTKLSDLAIYPLVS